MEISDLKAKYSILVTLVNSTFLKENLYPRS